MRKLAWSCMFGIWDMRWPAAILTVALLIITPAHAWDCSIPANRTLNVPGNECYVPPAPTPKRTPGRPITPRQTQGQTTNDTQSQGQGQSQNATGGAGGLGGAGGNSNATGGAGGSSSASAKSAANAGAVASQTANGGAASNAGNSQGITENSSYSVPRQAVDGYSAATNSTAACVRDQHAGIGAIIGGFSIGHGKRDKDCARQELAQGLWAQGQFEAGDRIYCAITEVHEALGDDCLKLLRHDVPPAIPPDVVTHAELLEIERRMIAHGATK